MVLANELIQSYGGILILVLIVVVGVLGYQAYRDQHVTGSGKKLRDSVMRVLKKNNCRIKGNQVTCQGPEFAGLGQKFTVSEAVERVLDLISTEIGGGVVGPPPSGPAGYPPMPPQQPRMPMQQQPRGPPMPVETNPRRAAMMQQQQQPGPQMGGGGGGFGGLMSADGEALGGSLAGSEPSGYPGGGASSYNPSVY